jgi:hypothetical protein
MQRSPARVPGKVGPGDGRRQPRPWRGGQRWNVPGEPGSLRGLQHSAYQDVQDSPATEEPGLAGEGHQAAGTDPHSLTLGLLQRPELHAAALQGSQLPLCPHGRR